MEGRTKSTNLKLHARQRAVLEDIANRGGRVMYHQLHAPYSVIEALRKKGFITEGVLKKYGTEIEITEAGRDALETEAIS